MAVSLYTSRVILSELGVDDYGLFNLIGGIVGLFSFISSALVAAIQRFFNVALGKKDDVYFSKIYSSGIIVFIFFSIFLLLVGETIGLWFVVNKLNIPEGREVAAVVVYQVSILTVLINLFRTPSNAAIIAYEKINFFAYLSIIEAVLKLLIVFMLKLVGGDKLIMYVALYCAVTLIINCIYKIYCNRKFTTCHFAWVWDKKLLKDLLSFSGWNVLSSGTSVVSTQANAYFINNFYSVTVNAAFGVASQVYNAVNGFVTNFQVAFKPQLIKTYTANEMDAHYLLIYRSAKFSFLLMLIITIPVVFNMDGLLSLWLVDVPLYTKEFCVFMLLAYLLDAIRSPLETSIFANGNIKDLQISRAVLDTIFLVLSFVLLSLRKPPYIVAILTFVEHGFFLVMYLGISKKLCALSLKNYFKRVILPCIMVLICSSLIPVTISFLHHNEVTIIQTILFVAIDFISAVAVSIFLGMTSIERGYLLTSINNKFKMCY